MLFRLFCITGFFVASLFACKGGYESCEQKIIDSKTIVKDSLYIPISKTQRLVFSKETPSANIIKRDPFLSLYLIEDTQSFNYPFVMNINVASGYASVDTQCATEGIIEQKQIGLNKLARFNEPVESPSLLLNSCCSLEGIVTPKGIITKAYIEHFLQSSESEYGDLGIRVHDLNGSVYVKYIDPFDKKILFQKGDQIVAFDGSKISDSGSFMKAVLFEKPGTPHTIELQRDKKLIKVKTLSKKRYGGGFLSDTFLEQKGIYFDKDLRINQLFTNNAYHGLHIGDKLISVNGVNVTNEQDVMKNLPHFMKFAILLFQRDDFQFFIRVN